MRPRAAVEEAALALGLKATEPFVSGRPADTQLVGGLRHGSALVHDPSHQQLTPEHVETRPMLGHESHLWVWRSDTPDPEPWLSFVNNVCGKYT